jgi:hypothetical protein
MKNIGFLIALVLFSISSLAQSAQDTSDGRFHDNLLDHLVGKWNVTSVAHGSAFTGVFDINWVLNHQNLHIHFKSNEVIPWWHVQMEFEEYIGYSHKTNRYIAHGMSIEGVDNDPSEGFCYGYRNGNEFKTVSNYGRDSLIVQKLTWQPASGTWSIKTVWMIGGVEGEPFLEMKLVALKPSEKNAMSKKKQKR